MSMLTSVCCTHSILRMERSCCVNLVPVVICYHLMRLFCMLLASCNWRLASDPQLMLFWEHYSTQKSCMSRHIVATCNSYLKSFCSILILVVNLKQYSLSPYEQLRFAWFSDPVLRKLRWQLFQTRCCKRVQHYPQIVFVGLVLWNYMVQLFSYMIPSSSLIIISILTVMTFCV